MAKASEVVTGLVIGGVVWFILSLFGFIPIIGWIIAWFIAPIVGGYEAGKYGGGISVLLLALLAPAVIAFLGFSLLSAIGAGLLGEILGVGLGLFVSIWAVLNLLFVGVGGAMGVSSRKPKQVQITGTPKVMTWTCTCGRTISTTLAPGEVVECNQCGKRYDESTILQTIRTGTSPISKTSMFCRECGAKIPRSSKFCNECGAKLT